MQEPRRLFTRYWLDLVFFVKTLRQERALWKQSANGLAESRVIESPEKEFSLHAWSGRIDAAALAEGIIVAPRPINARPNVVLDMSGVTFIDSTGLGLLVKIFKSCRDAGGALVLLKPSETMARILAAVRLDRMIPAAADLSDVTRLLPKPEQTAVQVFYDSEEARLVAVATVDLTAATATDFSTALRDHWQDSTTALTLDLDLRRVTFLDSSGLGALVKAAKLVRERNGAQFRLVNVPPNAANVIKLANLQSFLGVA
jgi:anti-anti-sigma factor